MGITTFAAIDVGSYNVCMDIYGYVRDLKSEGILMERERLLLTRPVSFAISLKIFLI